MYIGTAQYFGVVSETWSPVDEEEESVEILHIGNEAEGEQGEKGDKEGGEEMGDTTDLDYIVIKEVHKPFYDEMPSNCAVASSYYSLTAHRSFDKFDGTGKRCLLSLLSH
jgi:hypothetical protein